MALAENRRMVLRRLVRALALAGAFLLPLPTSAAQRGDDGLYAYEPSSIPDAPDTTAMLMRLGLGTVCVLGLSASTLWLGKRWLRGGPAPVSGAGQLRLVGSISLGNRCSVHLLETGDRQVLAGVDGSGLKSLVPLPQPFETALDDMENAHAPRAVAPESEHVLVGA